jgi:hypothetical protein
VLVSVVVLGVCRRRTSMTVGYRLIRRVQSLLWRAERSSRIDGRLV